MRDVDGKPVSKARVTLRPVDEGDERGGETLPDQETAADGHCAWVSDASGPHRCEVTAPDAAVATVVVLPSAFSVTLRPTTKLTLVVTGDFSSTDAFSVRLQGASGEWTPVRKTGLRFGAPVEAGSWVRGGIVRAEVVLESMGEQGSALLAERSVVLPEVPTFTWVLPLSAPSGVRVRLSDEFPAEARGRWHVQVQGLDVARAPEVVRPDASGRAVVRRRSGFLRVVVPEPWADVFASLADLGASLRQDEADPSSWVVDRRLAADLVLHVAEEATLSVLFLGGADGRVKLPSVPEWGGSASVHATWGHSFGVQRLATSMTARPGGTVVRVPSDADLEIQALTSRHMALERVRSPGPGASLDVRVSAGTPCARIALDAAGSTDIGPVRADLVVPYGPGARSVRRLVASAASPAEIAFLGLPVPSSGELLVRSRGASWFKRLVWTAPGEIVVELNQMEAQAMTALRVEVVDEQGAPVPHAAVTIVRPGEARLQGWTDGAGVAWMRGWVDAGSSVYLNVEAEGYISPPSRALAVEASPGGPQMSPVTVRLLRGGALRLRSAADPHGEEIEVTVRQGTRALRRSGPITAAGRWSLVFPGLPPGACTVEVLSKSSGRTTVVATQVVVGVELEVEIPR